MLTIKFPWPHISTTANDEDNSQCKCPCARLNYRIPCSRISLCAVLLTLFIAFYLSGCGPKHVPSKETIPGVPATQRPYKVNGRTYYPLPSAESFVETGYASWYGRKFHGRPTASGETYNMHAATAAHRTLPMNTYVRVTNLENGREIVVRINDRGPFVKNRVIDLSFAAARKLDIVKLGVAKVRVEVMGEVRFRAGNPATYKPHPDFKMGRFFIQVGAFLEPRNAYALKAKMTRHYKEVVVYRQPTGTKTFYRVQIFAATDYDAAKDFEARLERSGFPRAFVVAR